MQIIRAAMGRSAQGGMSRIGLQFPAISQATYIARRRPDPQVAETLDSSSIKVFLDAFIAESQNDENLNKCSDRELLDYRDTCKSVVSKVTGLTWASERKDRNSHIHGDESSPGSGAGKGLCTDHIAQNDRLFLPRRRPACMRQF